MAKVDNVISTVPPDPDHRAVECIEHNENSTYSNGNGIISLDRWNTECG